MPRRDSPITPIEMQEQTPTRSGLGALIENTLVRFLQQVINTAGETISEIIEWGLEIFVEAIEEALIDANKPIIERLIRELPEDSPMIPYLRAMVGGRSVAGAVSLAGLAAGMASTTAASFLQVLLRPFQYELDSKMRTARLDPSSAIMAVWREAITTAQMQDQLSDIGYSSGNIAAIETVLRPLVNENDLLHLWLRERISEAEVNDRLRHRGYDDQQIAMLKLAIKPLIEAGELSRLYLRGEISEGELRNRIKYRGYDDRQATELISLIRALLAVDDIVELYKRGELSEGELTARLWEHGYEPEQVSEILKVARPLSSPGDLRDMYWREILTEGQFRDRMSQFGYDDSQVAEFVELAKRIPPPPDLIAMAVREAFRPALIEQYAYLAEFPDEFAEWMLKQGYDEDWAKKYWVAHWRLPSLTMAYDMFHRRIITEDDLDRLFAVSDIAPFWRSKLKDAAYRPLTRVDVRRMYAFGVLNEGGVYNSYLDLGYNPDNAALMTEFTIKYEAGEERNGTKADILTAYNEGILTRGEARDALEGLGYGDVWIGYYLELQDLERERGKLSLETTLLKDQYIEGVITRSTVYEALGKWNLPDSQIRMLLDSWDIVKARQITLPSVTQLEAFLKQDIISEGKYRESMEQRHYTPDTVSYFLQEIRTQIAEAATKEEERARKEEQRVAVTEVKTAYDVEKARIDVDIAELKTALAENMVLLGIIVDLELIDEIYRQNDAMKVRITELQEEKARRKLELATELRGMRG